VTGEPTFYTAANARFFVGAVALVNSLRLSGNAGELVVLDAGLEPSQRRLLAPHARIVDVPAEVAARPYLVKPYAHRLEPRGVVVLIDCDVIVTRALADLVAAARDGKLCFFPDHPLARGRWFPEWESVLRLRSPLRRRSYLGAGWVALSVDATPGFLERWWEVCRLVPSGPVLVDPREPFDAADQDALNALLMSEIDDEAIAVLPETDLALWDVLGDVEAVDLATLEVRQGGAAPAILHYSFSPKPWEPSAWLRVRPDAFGAPASACALRRRRHRAALPARRARVAASGSGRPARPRRLDSAHGAARAVTVAMPGPVRRRLEVACTALFRRLRRRSDDSARILRR
jgi:hypothetical protein